MTIELSIVIPVYNEGEAILPVLELLERDVKTPHEILVCYDRPDDTTLRALQDPRVKNFPVRPIFNPVPGPNQAVQRGFRSSTSPWVLVYPADDLWNAAQIDRMMVKARQGADLVCASRFIPGGSMEGCPWLKAFLVRTASFTLRHLARLPTHDSTNGFRLFSRRVLDTIRIESETGFAFSIELLVKVHRLGWTVAEVPAVWRERSHGTSRFRVLRWLPAYLRWYGYAFATSYLRLGPERVERKELSN